MLKDCVQHVERTRFWLLALANVSPNITAERKPHNPVQPPAPPVNVRTRKTATTAFSNQEVKFAELASVDSTCMKERVLRRALETSSTEIESLFSVENVSAPLHLLRQQWRPCLPPSHLPLVQPNVTVAPVMKLVAHRVPKD